MAKEAKKELEHIVEAPATPPPPKSFRLQILLGLAALILFQMIVLYLLLPSRQVIEANIGLDPVSGTAGYETPNKLPANLSKKEPMVEKPIGEKPFKVSQLLDDTSEQTESLSMIFHAKIRKKDAAAFDRDYAENQFAVQDKVSTVMQTTTHGDRTQAGYTNIKEKTKKAINEVLGTPYVQEILVQEPTYQVQ